MALAAFDRMHARLLARLGEEAVLRGTEPCKVNIERGVVIDYQIGDDKYSMSEVAATVDVANILSSLNPKPGNALQVGTENFTIDAIASDNGYLTRCILR